MQSEINIKVGNKAPKDYFDQIKSQIENNNKLISGLSCTEDLTANLAANCIPVDIINMDSEDYSEFLAKRRKLMALKIKAYYFSL
ncbi:hypothetical protein METHB2_530014 [Candidatus Methylobacter favarea]|uniref:Uncharacterized protein n=1 Tax=Candidatus Methylobacter favarea TaxID=2707345 RepID=A0A8S0Y6Q9_9GAMM|nr:hypothetical protein [Candidatus Methylobacter favarea]CAA9891939.1 hypothetical protein METHB2_530014 [Candidatus Methylobacter favarea]